MPLTPFHMGPAASLKLVGGSWFSFAIFGYAQILMDLEPLLSLISSGMIAHGTSHTLGGAVAITVFTIVTGRFVYAIGARLWNGRLPLRELEIPDTVPFRAVVTAALLGTLSHLALDAMMHADVAPFAPIAGGNPLLAALSPSAIHLVCIGTGIVGAVGLLALRIWHDVEELADD